MISVKETDILIIGSGAAGCYAAIKASEMGLRTIVVSKSVLTRGGCSRMAGQHWGATVFNSQKEIDDDVERNFNQLGEHLRLIDRKILTKTVAYSPSAVRDLEEMGIYWRRQPDGTIALTGPPKPPLYPVASQQGETGAQIMDTLLSQIIKLKIPYLEEATTTSLLIRDGRCVGATVLDYRRGDLFAIKAKSTILATGHAGGYLWKYSTATRECTGDGVALAYRAGAEITNIEFQSWHFHDQVFPESARRLVHQWSDEGARVITPDGKQLRQELEKLVQTTDFGHNPDIGRIQAVRYGKRGGLYVTYSDRKPDELSSVIHTYGIIKKLGFRSTDKIPVGTSSHTTSGGIRINDECKTTIPGLYAAGGVSDGYPTILHCMWSANTSVTNAAKEVASLSQPVLDFEQVEAEEKRVLGLLRSKPPGGFTPSYFKERIREIMWEKMWFLKNEKEMREALNEISSMREQSITRMGLGSTSKVYNTSWLDALDVGCILDTCEMMVLASLTRKESRGVFKRTDYPEADDKDWFTQIVIKKSADGSPAVFTSPVGNFRN